MPGASAALAGVAALPSDFSLVASNASPSSRRCDQQEHPVRFRRAVYGSRKHGWLPLFPQAPRGPLRLTTGWGWTVPGGGTGLPSPPRDAAKIAAEDWPDLPTLETSDVHAQDRHARGTPFGFPATPPGSDGHLGRHHTALRLSGAGRLRVAAATCSAISGEERGGHRRARSWGKRGSMPRRCGGARSGLGRRVRPAAWGPLVLVSAGGGTLSRGPLQRSVVLDGRSSATGDEVVALRALGERPNLADERCGQ